MSRKRSVGRVISLILTGGGSLLALVAPVAEAAIAQRVEEPIVLAADRFPAWAGADVTRIVLYQKFVTAWVEIPSQIDERVIEHLNTNYTGGSASCNYPGDDPCEMTVLLSGVAGDGFGDRDEFVFMARDTADPASTSDWVGVPGVDTENTRYRILVRDSESDEAGYVYAYLWKTPPNHQTGVADYVTWTQDSGNPACIGQMQTPPRQDAACGWFRSTEQGSAVDKPRFNIFASGNWTTGAMCIKPFATDATCTVGDGTKNFLDETKFRTEGPSEKEQGWDVGCRAFMGVKDGPVRVVRRIQGAASGRYTTKNEYFYGTWLDQEMNIRVHPIRSLTLTLDHRATSVPNPPPESPAGIFTKNYSDINGCASAEADCDPMDVINGQAPPAVVGNFGDWVQVDFSRGGYAQFLEQKRAIGNATKTFEYSDDSSSGTSSEYQPGHFGQQGVKFKGTPDCLPDLQDHVCYEQDPDNDPRLVFARIVRTLVPLAVDGTPRRSEEGNKWGERRAKPFIPSPVPETFTQPPPGPGGGCAPTINGNVTSSTFANDVHVVTTACNPSDAVGVDIYRGYTTGIYEFIADLGKRTSLLDTNVRSGITYRYVARAYDVNGTLGPLSPELVLTVVDNVAPPVPTGLTATPGSRKVILSWTPPTDRDTQSFYASMAMVPGGPYTKMNPSAPIFCGGAQFAVVGLTPGQTYYFAVTAVDFVGNESAYSLEVNAVPTN